MQKVDGVLTDVSLEDLKLLQDNPSEFWRDVKVIGTRAFRGLEIGSITIPSIVGKIEEKAFFGACIQELIIESGLKEIGKAAFANCNGIKEITIPSSVEIIGDMAFYRCSTLEKVILNKGLKVIGKEAFYNTCVKQIEIPAYVEEVCEEAFSYCRYLKKIKVNENVKKIHGRAFIGANTNEIMMPYGVEVEGPTNFLEDYLSIYLLKSGGFLLTNHDLSENQFKEELSCAFIENVFDGIDYSKFIKNEERLVSLKKKTNFFFKNDLSFPKSLINQMTYEQFEEFTNKNFNEMKNLLNMAKRIRDSDLNDLYTLANNMGLLESKKTKININGNEVPVSSFAYTVLQGAINQGYLYFDEMHMRFQSMKLKKYNEAFLRFMADKTNLAELKDIEYEGYGNNMGFTCKVYEWFEERRNLTIPSNDQNEPINEEDRYKIRVYEATDNGVDKLKWKSPTVELFKKEFKNKKFFGITNENRHIAEYLDNFNLYEQKHFEKADEIDKERKEKGVKDHLLDNAIKEDIFTSIEDYKKRTELLRQNCINEANEVINNQADTASKIFTYEMLAKSDVANFAMGFLTSCCATLYGAGAGAQRAMILHEDMQPLVIKDIRGNIIAFGIIYVNRKEGYAVINDFEVNKKYEDDEEARKEIYYKAMKGVEAFVNEYNIENKDTPINIVTCGASPNWDAINKYIKENPKSSILKAPNFDEFKYTGSGSWSGDWHNEQYIIWGNGKEEKKNGR